MQRLVYIVGLMLLAALNGNGSNAENFLQSQSEFEAFKQQSSTEFQQSKDEYKLYARRLQRAFDQYREQCAQVWGDKNTVLPGRSNWISYQGDLQHRSIVDFEKGTVRVEIAVDKNQPESDSGVKKQLALSIVQSLKQGRDERSMLDIARQPVAVSSGPAVLQGQIADFDGQAISTSDYQALAQQAADRASKSIIQGNDGKQRLVYRTELKLVPDHIRQRAARYQPEVNAQSSEHKISAALVFAIMETESYFNPTARSPAPAFGLMQLVPTSGAREAYRYLYQRDRVVSDTYLYNPGNNIRLGTAFLNRLYYKYLAGITNTQARQWASIAAYNTGAGNVFRSFAGKYSQQKFGTRANWKRVALKEINRRSSEQVYTFLRNHLPYKETRHYLQKVRGRMAKYANNRGV